MTEPMTKRDLATWALLVALFAAVLLVSGVWGAATTWSHPSCYTHPHAAHCVDATGD